MPSPSRRSNRERPVRINTTFSQAMRSFATPRPNALGVRVHRLRSPAIPRQSPPDLTQQSHKTSTIRHSSTSCPKSKLMQIHLEIARADVVEYPVQATLEDAPEVLDVLRVNSPAHVLNLVVNHLVR